MQEIKTTLAGFKKQNLKSFIVLRGKTHYILKAQNLIQAERLAFIYGAEIIKQL